VLQAITGKEKIANRIRFSTVDGLLLEADEVLLVLRSPVTLAVPKSA